MEFDKFSDFLRLVRAFPSLDTLSLSDLQWRPTGLVANPPQFYQPLRRPLHLPLLNLRTEHGVDVARWLLKQSTIPTIHAFYFETHKYEVNHAMKKLIEETGDTINDLRFSLTFVNSVEDNLHHSIDLGHCINLRKLQLHNIILIPNLAITHAIAPWVPVMLSQANSKNLEEIVLTLLVNEQAGLECIDWKKISLVLQEPRFNALRILRTHIKQGGNLDVVKMEDIIRKKLQAQQDILLVEFSEF
ncbi:hypothetical protein BDQ12DRAFT_721347 [Crucibulum laeve]|uniref:F-box domain-containing protein n=1 Tax=Crucibulum laeve TaxID=68775 RepID=A0A5C3MA92_9AGAR|nr:hypothetical protein BDQ12DRAFT_721347 [Crucibulum laeve]